MKHLIIGNGEIGNHIIETLQDTDSYLVKDINDSLGFAIGDTYDIMHVCIPYKDIYKELSYKMTIESYIKIYSPDYVIIHSTVSVGSTDNIDFDNIVYSPVRGRHNGDISFTNDIKRYVRYYCGKNEASEKKFLEIFGGVFKCVKAPNIKSLELAKINCTTYMLWNVLYEKELYKLCEKNGFDFDFIYTKWNETYNDKVYFKWKRPIYEHMDGAVGGHCLIPNLSLYKCKIHDIINFMME